MHIFSILNHKEIKAKALLEQLLALEKQKNNAEKAIDGLSRSIDGADNDPRTVERTKKMKEKEESKSRINEDIVKIANEQLVLDFYESRGKYEEICEKSGLNKVVQELTDYNNNVATIRCSNIGKEGIQFENECEGIVRELFMKKGMKLLKNVQFKGISFPEQATSEFDFILIDSNNIVTHIIEAKRG